jgi:purine-binding chemotaxis protein CheW
VHQHQPSGFTDVGLAVSSLDELQLLVVEVAGHRCGLPLEAVVEIHPAVHLGPLPDAPDVVVGLVNRRGTAVPVLSLRRRLGLAGRALHADDHLVVLQLADRQVGLLLDAAIEVLAVPVVEIDAAATTSAAHSRGAAVLTDGLLVIVDLSTFLSPDEAVVLDQSLAAADA